ncbi:energy transducer TonB [Autumnicola musiva]|uniref:Energy transducer TonB n=1 Tax=Autumnicola musiva TaxID=3075589 RepID=A0ABU3D0J8_9FLAO|nr:energy transducer TonB [Zunongwangia sp. F117]MDT0675059.1 energy transducer TonB [Zunongwangia sp. F117]
MKPKKNPKADLSRKWVLFFQIGLILVLLLTLNTIEWKTYTSEKDNNKSLGMEFDKFITEEIPPAVVIQPKLPEPLPEVPQEPLQDVYKLTEDNENSEPEDNVEPTHVDPADLSDLPEVGDIEDPVTEEPVEKFPFEVIEFVPIYPGCESLDNNANRKACMSSKISNFINREFNTSLGDKLGLSGMNLVIVQFVINQEGKIEQIKTRAPHPALEKEAKRVIEKLPVMQPGKQRGKAVPVSYSIPIRFKVQD